MKKETLEEAAQRIFSDFGDITRPSAIKRALELAKWQQEIMYSEEEVIQTIRDFKYDSIHIGDMNPEKWFEQFKKK